MQKTKRRQSLLMRTLNFDISKQKIFKNLIIKSSLYLFIFYYINYFKHQINRKSMSKRIEIKKPWGVCEFIRFKDFGKIISENKTTLKVIYSEKQQYPSELWDSNSVKRFNELEKAINYCIKTTDIRDRNFTKKEIMTQAMYCFPSYFNKKSKN